MFDCSVSLNSIIAGALWLLGLFFVLIDVMCGRNTDDLGVIFAIAGATLTVRAMLVGPSLRERTAFELGREFEDGRLRSLR